jgi:antitoxin (DNA-binding transcriptional repressor) of toxin-antitoxin stability system
MPKGPRGDAIVGVREFRARISAYLRAAAAGVTTVVGDRRRRPVARLVPVERSAEQEALDRLAAAGVLRRGHGKPGTARAVRPRKSARLLSDIVREQRD